MFQVGDLVVPIKKEIEGFGYIKMSNDIIVLVESINESKRTFNGTIMRGSFVIDLKGHERVNQRGDEIGVTGMKFFRKYPKRLFKRRKWKRL